MVRVLGDALATESRLNLSYDLKKSYRRSRRLMRCCQCLTRDTFSESLQNQPNQEVAWAYSCRVPGLTKSRRWPVEDDYKTLWDREEVSWKKTTVAFIPATHCFLFVSHVEMQLPNRVVMSHFALGLGQLSGEGAVKCGWCGGGQCMFEFRNG